MRGLFKEEMKENLSFRAYLIFVVSVAALTFLQRTDFLNIYGIKPNLALVVLITLSFFIKPFWKFIIVFFVVQAILGFSEYLRIESIALFLIAILVFLFNNSLPWRPVINNIILIAVATLVFHAFSTFSFLSLEPLTILGEAAYNVFLGTVFYYIFGRLINYGQKF